MAKKKKIPGAAAAASKVAREAMKATRAAKKAARATANGGPLRSTKDRRERRQHKEEQRAAKMRQRREEKRAITQDMWNQPAPAHLKANLEKPKIKDKYQSYLEFTDNPDKKQKKLEFQAYFNINPPPGYTFVPVGDPVMTATCKELSREQEAMVFIVSTQKPEASKISEHVHRIGFHFRETIVEQAREIVGDTVISKPLTQGFIEPIPESQEEINKQADSAIRDLFPRIPNTDRTMILEHAFKKGAQFHGEPTVGLQSDLPLSRRVQLAVLAHIRHTHTRYDELLRETTWLNARKAVEPICLDVIMKWRGDDETGRDQMDEILREVVIITDSESGDDSSDEDSSDEDGEVTSLSSTEPPSQTNSRNQNRPAELNVRENGSRSMNQRPTSPHDGPSTNTRGQKDKRAQKGFKRYQAAWNDAVNRRQGPAPRPGPSHGSPSFQPPAYQQPRSHFPPVMAGPTTYSMHDPPATHYPNTGYHYAAEETRNYATPVMGMDPHGVQYVPNPGASTHMNEEPERLYSARPTYDSMPPPQGPYVSSTTERPPQVVRGSYKLQDMLVESVETPSSDVFPAISNGRHGFNHSQDSYPRRVVDYQQQRLPAQPEIIVIEDDSPLPKRRRVQDDTSSHFRPVQSRDHAPYFPAPYSDSHLASRSGQSDDFFAQRLPVSQATQGSVRGMPNMYTDSVTGEQLPIYDAPPMGRIPARSEHSRRPDGGHATGLQEADYNTRHNGFSQPSYANEASNPRQAKYINYDDDVVIVEHSQPQPVNRSYNNGYHSSTPAYDLPSKSSRYDMGHASVGPDSNLVQSFSQSRIDGPLPYARDGYTVISERTPQTFTSQENRPSFENRGFNSYAPSSSTQTWQRPLPQMQQGAPATYYEQPQQPAYHNTQGPVPTSQNGSWQQWR